MKRVSKLVLTVLGAFTLGTSSVSAEWSQDPSARTPVCTADYAQYLPLLVAVEDGFVVSWSDRRREDAHIDVYAQQFDIDGEMLWSDNGRVIAEGPAGVLVDVVQANTGLARDGSGGALVAWNDHSQLQGYMTRVSADGTVAWGVPGEPIQYPDTAVPVTEYFIFSNQWDFAADSEGGVFAPVTWFGGKRDILGRFASDGRLRTQWFDDPSVEHGQTLTFPLVPVVEPDGRDAVVAVWIQGNGYFCGSVEARKLVDPETAWPSAPDVFDDVWGRVALFDPGTTFSAWRVAAVPDGTGGVIAAWLDNRTGTYRVYAQRVDGDGNVIWAAEGVDVSGDVASLNWAERLKMAADGAGGAVIAWNNPFESPSHTVRAQRLDENGNALWTSGGVVVATDGLANSSPVVEAVIRSTDGNFITLYYSALNGQLIAQKIEPAQGEPLWQTGRVVYDGCFSTYYERARMVSDGRGGAIVAFAPCDGNIYAHRLEENLPDLTVEEIKAPRMLRPDKPITVRVTVGNAGDADVSGTYAVSLLLDGDLLKEQDVTNAPVAGEELVVSLSGVRIPDLSSGNHSLEAAADGYDTIAESSEENNTASINVRVK